MFPFDSLFSNSVFHCLEFVIFTFVPPSNPNEPNIDMIFSGHTCLSLAGLVIITRLHDTVDCLLALYITFLNTQLLRSKSDDLSEITMIDK